MAATAQEKPFYVHYDPREIYETLCRVYDRYMDMREEYRKVASVWVMAVRYHNCFETFPYLYLNAMKGSGKTRFMKLTSLMVGGDLTTSVTESILFRENTPLFIDEAENVSREDQATKRELLNVAYKKGGVVKRTERNEGGQWEVVGKDSYRALSLANIDGLDDVLEDRCIKIVLEKSFDRDRTRRLEMFALDKDVSKVVDYLSIEEMGVVGVDTVVLDGEIDGGNVTKTYTDICYHYMNDTKDTTPTHTTHDTNDTETTEEAQLIIWKVEQTDLLGRDLELWMPLFVIAAHLGEDVLDEMIAAAQKAAAERQQSNMMENPDVILIGFLQDYLAGKEERQYVPLTEIVRDFLERNEGDEWMTTKWLGRALVRNSLIASKRRLGKGREVILDKKKVLEKAKKFGLVDDLTAFSTQPTGTCEVCGAGRRKLTRLANRFEPLKQQMMCEDCAPEHAVLEGG